MIDGYALPSTANATKKIFAFNYFYTFIRAVYPYASSLDIIDFQRISSFYKTNDRLIFEHQKYQKIVINKTNLKKINKNILF